MTAPGQTAGSTAGQTAGQVAGAVAGTAQEQAGAVAGTVKEQAASVAGTAGEAAGQVAGTAKEQAGSVVGETVDQVRDLTGQVREQARQQVDQQASRLTETLRDVSRQLSEGDTSGLVGTLLTEAGTRVQRLADHLEQTGPQGLLEEVRDYARRSPGPFLLGAALAGLVTGRLVKGMTAGGGSSPAPAVSGGGDPLYDLPTAPPTVSTPAPGNDPFGGDTYGTMTPGRDAGLPTGESYGTGGYASGGAATSPPYPSGSSPYESGYGTQAPYSNRGTL